MKWLRLIVCSMVIILSAQALWADYDTDYSTQERLQLLRDETYEQNLRWEASADKTITPAKVLRWLMGYRGAAINAPTKTEFQPIFNTENGRIRVVAAIAYKF